MLHLIGWMIDAALSNSVQFGDQVYDIRAGVGGDHETFALDQENNQCTRVYKVCIPNEQNEGCTFMISFGE